MADYASATLLGRVANVTTHAKRASFKLAVTYRPDGPTHWFDIVAFDDKQISIVRDHVQKGRLILIACRPQTRTWQHEGQPRKAVEFVLERLVLLPKSTMPAQHEPLQEPPASELAEGEPADEQEPGVDQEDL